MRKMTIDLLLPDELGAKLDKLADYWNWNLPVEDMLAGMLMVKIRHDYEELKELEELKL